jgi:hypothetical protein
MLISAEYDAFLVKSVLAVRPYLNRLILVGGCASALYAYHQAASGGLRAMVTGDIDIASADQLPITSQDKPLAQLLAEAGFEEESASEGNPPVVKYVSGDVAGGFDLEFLCPLRGHREDRRPEQGSGVRIQSDIVATPLQYLEILLINPWPVDLARMDPSASGEILPRVQLPNPASYIVQKLLIRDRCREEAARRKDCYYIYNLSVMFRDAADKIAQEYRNLEKRVHPGWLQKFKRVFADTFASPLADGPVSAVTVHQASPDHVREAKEKNFTVSADSVCQSVKRLFPAFGL